MVRDRRSSVISPPGTRSWARTAARAGGVGAQPGEMPGRSPRPTLEQANRNPDVDPQVEKMASWPVVAWSFAFPVGSITWPSMAIGLFQWPAGTASVVISLPLAGW